MMLKQRSVSRHGSLVVVVVRGLIGKVAQKKGTTRVENNHTLFLLPWRTHADCPTCCRLPSLVSTSVLGSGVCEIPFKACLTLRCSGGGWERGNERKGV